VDGLKGSGTSPAPPNVRHNENIKFTILMSKKTGYGFVKSTDRPKVTVGTASDFFKLWL